MSFNMFRSSLKTLAAILILSAAVFAVPPPNDNVANPTVLAGVSGSNAGTVADATRETGEPNHSLLPTDNVFRTVWYQWTAPQTRPFSVAVQNGGFDAAIAVYTGSAFPLTPIVRNNDTNGDQPRVEFEAIAGTTYVIVVGSHATSTVPQPDFTLNWAMLDAPSNDNFAQAMQLSGTSGTISATTGNATSEPQEPLFGTGKTIWFTFTNNSATALSMNFTNDQSPNPNYDTKLAVYTGNSLGSLTPVVKNDNTPATFKSRVRFLAQPGTTYRIALDLTPQSPNGSVIFNWQINRPKYFTDFALLTGDPGEIYYDESADITMFRPSTGIWYSLNANPNTFTAIQFGINGDKPVAADYDGDGITDLAVTRAAGGSKVWYIRNSLDGSMTTRQWGLSSDKEVPGDYDGDGRMDIAVFRPSTSTWYIWRSSDNQFVFKEFGLPGDIPVLGEFRNTPVGADIAVFRPSTGTWYVFDGVNVLSEQFGTIGDIPVPADYDFDGFTDRAVFRPSTSDWYTKSSRNQTVTFNHWGATNDIPMIGDFDDNTNDKADFAVYRPSDQTWYILKAEGTAIQYQQFGLPGDIPAASLSLLMQ